MSFLKSKTFAVCASVALTVILCAASVMQLAKYCEAPHRQEHAEAAKGDPAKQAAVSGEPSAFLKVVEAIRDGQKAQQEAESASRSKVGWLHGFACELKIGEALLSLFTLWL